MMTIFITVFINFMIQGIQMHHTLHLGYEPGDDQDDHGDNDKHDDHGDKDHHDDHNNLEG